MTGPGVLTQPAPSENASVWEDFIDIFYAPADVFRRRQNGSWFIPMLVATLAIELVTFLTYGALEGAYRPIIDKAIETLMQNPQATPEMADRVRSFVPWQIRLGSLLLIPILILGVGTVSWITGKLFGSRQTYRSAMVVAGYAQVARIVGAIVFGIEGLLMDPARITSLAAIALSPTRFVARDSVSPFVYGLLFRLDVFTVWATVLLAIGLYVTGKISKGSAATAAVIVWFLGSLQTIRAMMLGQM